MAIIEKPLFMKFERAIQQRLIGELNDTKKGSSIILYYVSIIIRAQAN
jgi:hypothetical protein